jgi:hypothetical protein
MPRTASNKQPKNYITNKEFLKEIIQSKKNNKLTPKAEAMFIILAKKAQTKLYYQYNDDKEDCLMTAYYDMFANWKNFDAERSQNAFAYFTEIAKRGFARQWNILKNHKGDPDKKTFTYSYNRGFSDDGESEIMGAVL